MAVARTVEQMTGVPRRPGARALGLIAVLLAVAVCAVLVALVAVVVPRLSGPSGSEARRTAVLQAARQQAVNFTTLDHRTLDRDLGRVLEGATGQFRSQFEAGTQDLSELVTANKAVSEGEVLEAGLVSDDADSARVLVVADSTVTNTADPEPQKRHYRMQLDLVLRRGHWLVSDLQFVG